MLPCRNACTKPPTSEPSSERGFVAAAFCIAARAAPSMRVSGGGAREKDSSTTRSGTSASSSVFVIALPAAVAAAVARPARLAESLDDRYMLLVGCTYSCGGPLQRSTMKFQTAPSTYCLYLPSELAMRQ